MLPGIILLHLSKWALKNSLHARSFNFLFGKFLNKEVTAQCEVILFLLSGSIPFLSTTIFQLECFPLEFLVSVRSLQMSQSWEGVHTPYRAKNCDSASL